MGRFMLSVASRHKRNVHVLGQNDNFDVEFTDQRGKTACIVSLERTKTMLHVVVRPCDALKPYAQGVAGGTMHRHAVLTLAGTALNEGRTIAIEDVLMPQGSNGDMEFTMRGPDAHDGLHSLLLLLAERDVC